MNVENINEVADAIEQHSIPGLGFNMGTYHNRWVDEYSPDRSGHNCGTTACIAGYALAVQHGGKIPAGPQWDADAAKFLGLPNGSARNLFVGRPPSTTTMDNTTPAQAVAVLRHLAATGEVDWSVADGVAP